MYLSVHGTAALVVAQASPNPLFAFIFGIASHLILDLIPHGDEFIVHGFSKQKAMRRRLGAAMLDTIVLLFLLATYYVSTPTINLTITGWALVGALLPDFLEAVYLITEWKPLEPWHNWHESLHDFFKHHLHWTQGVIVQVMVLTALWLLVV